MCRIKQLTIVGTVLIFLMGCAGQPIKNSVQPSDLGNQTTDENTAEQWEPEESQTGMFSDRNLHIMTDVLIAALVVTEICLFWYFMDKHHDSKDPFLWVGPIWPLWY